MASNLTAILRDPIALSTLNTISNLGGSNKLLFIFNLGGTRNNVGAEVERYKKLVWLGS